LRCVWKKKIFFSSLLEFLIFLIMCVGVFGLLFVFLSNVKLNDRILRE